MRTLEIRWPTVALVAAVCAAVVAIFAFAGPDERVTLLGILAMMGTAGAAVMRAAFGAPEAAKPKRVELPRDEDDDDPGEGGEVLADADGPPTRPTRVPERVSVKRPERQLRKLAKLWRMGLGMPAQRAARLCMACLALMLSACSPSALQTHATIALVASHTLEVTRAAEDATCLSLRDGCAADLACLVSAKDTCVTIGDAQDAAVAAVGVYVDAVQLAGLADEGRVMEALRFALEAATRAWASLGERLAVVGIALPSLGGGL